KEPLHNAAPVEHRQAARARAVEDGGGTVRVPDAEHLARYLVERFVPRDPLKVADTARPCPAQWVLQPVRMVDALGLAEAAHARMKRRHLGGPAAGIGADPDDAPLAYVGIDHAATPAVVAARAGDDGLAGTGCDARGLVVDPARHGAVSITRNFR